MGEGLLKQNITVTTKRPRNRKCTKTVAMGPRFAPVPWALTWARCRQEWRGARS